MNVGACVFYLTDVVQVLKDRHFSAEIMLHSLISLIASIAKRRYPPEKQPVGNGLAHYERSHQVLKFDLLRNVFKMD